MTVQKQISLLDERLRQMALEIEELRASLITVRQDARAEALRERAAAFSAAVHGEPVKVIGP